MSAVSIENLTVRYDEVVALQDFSLEAPRGSIVAVLGPSGCGKTTLLRAIAGLERPTAGRIRIDDALVAEAGRLYVPPEQRGVGLVFQDYALFPHLSVAANVGYGVRDRRHRGERVDEMLSLVGLQGLKDRFPAQLSGGQQQRVALARALAPEPAALLLDEPFSNLDADQRARVRGEVREILRAAGTTAIFVTHDRQEAFELADLVAVLQGGRLEQAGPPEAVYRSPNTKFVATFLGRAFFIGGTATANKVSTSLGSFEGDMDDGPVELLVRPEDVELTEGGDGLVIARTFGGAHLSVDVRLADGTQITARTSTRQAWSVGDFVTARLQPTDLVWFRDGLRLTKLR